MVLTVHRGKRQGEVRTPGLGVSMTIRVTKGVLGQPKIQSRSKKRRLCRCFEKLNKDGRWGVGLACYTRGGKKATRQQRRRGTAAVTGKTRSITQGTVLVGEFDECNPQSSRRPGIHRLRYDTTSRAGWFESSTIGP